MANYQITRSQPDMVRVEFMAGWNAEADSTPMFHDLLDTLNDSDDRVTLLIVAGGQRPVYSDVAAARDILYHDSLRRIVIVAAGAHHAVAHMSATRGEYGLPPIPISAFTTEDEAKASLPALKG